MSNATLILTLLGFFCSVAKASEFVGARTAGLGGAGSAAVEQVDSLYLNPAAIASIGKLHFGSGYTFGALVPGVSRETFTVTMSDGTPGTALPGAFAYRYHRVGIGEDTFREQEFRAGFAYRLHPKASLGMGFSHIRSRGGAAGEYTQKNMDLGLLLNVVGRWGVAATADGLLRVDENVPLGLRRQQRWGLGTEFDVMRIFKVRYDLKTTLHREEENVGKLLQKMGISFLLRGYFQLNMGLTVDDILEQRWSTVGLVWSGPKLKVGYSIQNESRMGLGMRHFVDFWLDL